MPSGGKHSGGKQSSGKQSGGKQQGDTPKGRPLGRPKGTGPGKRPSTRAAEIRAAGTRGDSVVARVRAVFREHYGGNTLHIAHELGISQATVSRWGIKDEDPVALELLKAMHRVWHLNMHWLLTGQGPKHGTAPAGDPGYAAGVRDTVNAIGRGPLTEQVERELVARLDAALAAEAGQAAGELRGGPHSKRSRPRAMAGRALASGIR
jgi:hypothetical protein